MMAANCTGVPRAKCTERSTLDAGVFRDSSKPPSDLHRANRQARVFASLPGRGRGGTNGRCGATGRAGGNQAHSTLRSADPNDARERQLSASNPLQEEHRLLSDLQRSALASQ